MSKKANPTFIGAFVLVGLAVSVTAIMVLGGSTQIGRASCRERV